MINYIRSNIFFLQEHLFEKYYPFSIAEAKARDTKINERANVKDKIITN